MLQTCIHCSVFKLFRPEQVISCTRCDVGVCSNKAFFDVVVCTEKACDVVYACGMLPKLVQVTLSFPLKRAIHAPKESSMEILGPDQRYTVTTTFQTATMRLSFHNSLLNVQYYGETRPL